MDDTAEVKPKKRSAPEFMPTRRALVTGGAAFLGSHLCDALLREGYAVVAFDNLLTGRIANIEHLRSEPRFEFVERDVCNSIECGRLRLPLRQSSKPSGLGRARGRDTAGWVLRNV